MSLWRTVPNIEQLNAIQKNTIGEVLGQMGVDGGVVAFHQQWLGDAPELREVLVVAADGAVELALGGGDGRVAALEAPQGVATHHEPGGHVGGGNGALASSEGQLTPQLPEGMRGG